VADDGTLCFDFDPMLDPVPEADPVLPEDFVPDPRPDRDAPDPPAVPPDPPDPVDPVEPVEPVAWLPDAAVPAGVAALDPPPDDEPLDAVAFVGPVVVTFPVTETVQAGAAWPTLAMAVLA
jgi:hypothetical protein